MLKGLGPLVYEDSKVLILGSMPGRQSLENARYYDYAANKFWGIMFRFFGRPVSDDYAVKKQMLKEGKIALWDSVASCYRNGSSLDSAIRGATGNDISSLLKSHPSIEFVITNGRASEKYLKKFNPDVKYVCLPSTSPANASVKNVESVWTETLRKFLYRT